MLRDSVGTRIIIHRYYCRVDQGPVVLGNLKAALLKKRPEIAAAIRATDEPLAMRVEGGNNNLHLGVMAEAIRVMLDKIRVDKEMPDVPAAITAADAQATASHSGDQHGHELTLAVPAVSPGCGRCAWVLTPRLAPLQPMPRRPRLPPQSLPPPPQPTRPSPRAGPWMSSSRRPSSRARPMVATRVRAAVAALSRSSLFTRTPTTTASTGLSMAAMSHRKRR